MSPLSSDPDARARQLANLRSGQRAGNLTPGAGQERAALANTRHGAYSSALLANVEGEVVELRDALAEAAPVRDAAGQVPAADYTALEIAARRLKRYRHLSSWLDLHGRIDEETGDVKPAARLELDAEKALTASLDALGMNPQARARLNLNLARTVDLATAMSEPDPELRRSLMRQAGVPVDAEEAEGV